MDERSISVDTSYVSTRKTRLQTILTFIYNKNDKSFCSRTLKSWGQIIGFVLLFYAIITIIMVIFMLGHRHLLKKTYPAKPWRHEPFFKRTSGLQMFPDVDSAAASVIIYSVRKSSYYTHYTKYVEDAYAHLEEKNVIMERLGDDFNKLFVQCDDKNERPNRRFSCYQALTALGPCADKPYGFQDKKPCIYLRLNKVGSWQPEPYDVLPRDLPDSSIEEILNSDLPLQEYIWVDCNGLSPADKEHLGEIKYYPHRGINIDFYPYSDIKNFLAPVVAIKLDNIQPGTFIEVSCKIYAKNIPSPDNNVYIYIYIDPD